MNQIICYVLSYDLSSSLFCLIFCCCCCCYCCSLLLLNILWLENSEKNNFGHENRGLGICNLFLLLWIHFAKLFYYIVLRTYLPVDGERGSEDKKKPTTYYVSRMNSAIFLLVLLRS